VSHDDWLLLLLPLLLRWVPLLFGIAEQSWQGLRMLTLATEPAQVQ
jgi:hypothetical protein